VGIAHCFSDLLEDVDLPLQEESRKRGLQTLALHVLQHEIGDRIFERTITKGDDIRMAEPSQDRGLLLKPDPPFRIILGRMQDLQGVALARSSVYGLIDRAHPPHTESSHQSESTEAAGRPFRISRNTAVGGNRARESLLLASDLRDLLESDSPVKEQESADRKRNVIPSMALPLFFQTPSQETTRHESAIEGNLAEEGLGAAGPDREIEGPRIRVLGLDEGHPLTSDPKGSRSRERPEVPEPDEPGIFHALLARQRQ
jgi:hypothetical protein